MFQNFVNLQFSYLYRYNVFIVGASRRALGDADGLFFGPTFSHDPLSSRLHHMLQLGRERLERSHHQHQARAEALA